MEATSSNRKRLNQSTLNGLSKKQRIEEDNTERRAGVIKNMVLKNFMCHSLLEIKFVNNTSVLIGQNGSGKSAILTALVIGLGGKASLTNRGSNVKGFVKAGTNSATIEITLHNGGPMAYRPNIYGDSIIVVRHFTASGTSSYKIKSHKGEIVSTQAREIKNITTNLNIQVDNPICILNQDTSRNFLSSSDPKQKFILFSKATKLDTLAGEYENVKLNLRISKSTLQDKNKHISKMEEDLKKMETKMQDKDSVVSLEGDRLSLQVELLWSKAREAEVEVQAQQQVVDRIAKKCEDCKINSTKRNDEINELKNSMRDLDHQMDELKNTIKIQSKTYLDCQNTLEKLLNLHQTKDRERRQIENSIKTKNQDIQVLEQEIANSNENKNKVEEEKVKRARQIEDLEQKLKANNDILLTARNDTFQINSDITKKVEDERTLRQEISEVDQQMSQTKDRLNSLKAESGNILLLYGQHIPKIKQLIEQNKRKFQQIPRGPLGSYIKLKDKKWAVAAEGYLGAGLLNSFFVDNKQDNQLLQDIFRKVAPNKIPTIITSKFFHKVHDVSRNLVHSPSDCIGLFELLEIEDPVVANCIIDERGVEGILLIPNDERAMTLLSNSENVPKNCTQAVTIKGDRYYPDPNYKTYCSDYHHAQYLQVDTGEHLKNLEQNIQDLHQKKQRILSQYNQVQNEKNIQINRQNELKSKIEKLTSNRSEFRKQLEKIKSMAEPEATNIEVLENELTEVKNAITEKTANLEKLNSELKELAIPISETEAKMKQLKTATKNLNQRLATLQEMNTEKSRTLREIETGDSFQIKKVAEYENRLAEQRVILVTKQNIFEGKKQEARREGKKPQNIRDVPEIMEKIDTVQNVLRKIQMSPEAYSDLLNKYTELKVKYSHAKEISAKLKEDVDELELAERYRQKHYNVTEGYFISYIKNSFKKILEFRQFQGYLDIDVERKKLELTVIPQQGSQGKITTSNLSGGERSFSTVAFLYSLWQCMDFPFYFLDEFDVYMDKLNRTKVFNVLLHHSDTKPELQFVFLTPQDISFLNDKVTVLRLEDPKRFNA